MPIVAKLSRNARFPGRFSHDTGFIDGSTKGFLTVEVFALVNHGKSNDSMRMVRRRNQNGVDVLFVEHLMIIPVGRARLAVLLADQIGSGLEPCGAAVIEHAIVAKLINVAKSDNAGIGLIEQLLHVDDALAACTNNGDVDLLAGRGVATKDLAGHKGKGCRRSGAAQKMPSGYVLTFTDREIS